MEYHTSSTKFDKKIYNFLRQTGASRYQMCRIGSSGPHE